MLIVDRILFEYVERRRNVKVVRIKDRMVHCCVIRRPLVLLGFKVKRLLCVGLKTLEKGLARFLKPIYLNFEATII